MEMQIENQSTHKRHSHLLGCLLMVGTIIVPFLLIPLCLLLMILPHFNPVAFFFPEKVTERVMVVDSGGYGLYSRYDYSLEGWRDTPAEGESSYISLAAHDDGKDIGVFYRFYTYDITYKRKGLVLTSAKRASEQYSSIDFELYEAVVDHNESGEEEVRSGKLVMDGEDRENYRWNGLELELNAAHIRAAYPNQDSQRFLLILEGRKQYGFRLFFDKASYSNSLNSGKAQELELFVNDKLFGLDGDIRPANSPAYTLIFSRHPGMAELTKGLKYIYK